MAFKKYQSVEQVEVVKKDEAEAASKKTSKPKLASLPTKV